MKVPRVLAKYVDVVNHPGVYIKAEIDKVTSEVKAKVQALLPKIVLSVLAGVFGLFLLIFASVTLALFLNDVLDSPFYGFLIVTGLYLLVVIFLVIALGSESMQRSMFGVPKEGSGASSRRLVAPEKVDPTAYRMGQEQLHNEVQGRPTSKSASPATAPVATPTERNNPATAPVAPAARASTATGPITPATPVAPPPSKPHA
ncbi:MAG: phage holin family protein [Tunicatimonas sp.]